MIASLNQSLNQSTLVQSVDDRCEQDDRKPETNCNRTDDTPDNVCKQDDIKPMVNCKQDDTVDNECKKDDCKPKTELKQGDLTEMFRKNNEELIRLLRSQWKHSENVMS